MRVLLSGQTGFVGAALAHGLLAEGHELVGLSRRRSGLPGLDPELQVDLSRDDALTRIPAQLGECSAVVHCAASIGGSAEDLIRTNCLGTQRMLALASAVGARRFVFISGITVIGIPSELPITERHPTAPTSPYTASKLFGEHLVATGNDGAMTTISLRVSAPVGPAMPRGRILRVFTERASAGQPLNVLGKGGRRQNYVHTEDVAAAVALALGSATEGVVNIGGPRAVSNLELARLCVERAGSDSEIVTDGIDPSEGEAWEISLELAERRLGYMPSREVEVAVDELLAAPA